MNQIRPPSCLAARARTVARWQGVYYLVTGVWPFLSRTLFEAVTGPKLDYWLVLSVGALVAVVGVVLLAAARARWFACEIALLGVAAALALGVIDVYAASQPRTSGAYLADAVLESGWVILWVWAWPKQRADGE